MVAIAGDRAGDRAGDCATDRADAAGLPLWAFTPVAQPDIRTAHPAANVKVVAFLTRELIAIFPYRLREMV